MFEVAHIWQAGQGWDLSGQSGVVKVRGPAGSGCIYSRWEVGGGEESWGGGGVWMGVEGVGGVEGRGGSKGDGGSGGREKGGEWRNSGGEWEEWEEVEENGGN